ncbi:MAG: hypothetical protein HYZ89_04000 [Candidatus Omnitrophica bacterium]|nr:hypothetical protein [Candidatus Omnitrophota bacterium]
MHAGDRIIAEGRRALQARGEGELAVERCLREGIGVARMAAASDSVACCWSAAAFTVSAIAPVMAVPAMARPLPISFRDLLSSSLSFLMPASTCDAASTPSMMTWIRSAMRYPKLVKSITGHALFCFALLSIRLRLALPSSSSAAICGIVSSPISA